MSLKIFAALLTAMVLVSGCATTGSHNSSSGIPNSATSPTLTSVAHKTAEDYLREVPPATMARVKKGMSLPQEIRNSEGVRLTGEFLSQLANLTGRWNGHLEQDVGGRGAGVIGSNSRKEIYFFFWEGKLKALRIIEDCPEKGDFQLKGGAHIIESNDEFPFLISSAKGDPDKKHLIKEDRIRFKLVTERARLVYFTYFPSRKEMKMFAAGPGGSMYSGSLQK